MATVLVFTIPVVSHIYPALPIVAELARRGDRVIYYCAEEHRARIEATGAEFRPITWDFSELTANRFPHQCEVALEWLRLCEDWLPRLLPEVKELRPSYLLVDFFCPWGRYVAKTLGLPLALMTATFARVPGVLPPEWVMSLFDVGPSPQRIRAVLEVRAISKRLALRYGVRRLRMPIELIHLEGDIILSTAPLIMQPRRELLDETYHWVGHFPESRAGDKSEAMPALDDRPVVYASFGSYISGSSGFFHRCLQAFSDGRYQLILSIGPHLDPATLGPLPSHVHTGRYLPQLEVLRRTTVFLTHGGMNSVTEAIWNEVPMLAMPQMADQFANADRVEALGLGRVLKPWQRSAAHLRKSVDALASDPGVRERCREARNALLKDGGGRRAADILQQFAARQGSRAATG